MKNMAQVHGHGENGGLAPPLQSIGIEETSSTYRSFQRPNVSFRRRTSTLRRSKTKSRLTDLPEEQYTIPENVGRGLASGETENRSQGDYSDTPVRGEFLDDFKRANLGKLTSLRSVSLLFTSIILTCSLSIPVVSKHILCDLPIWKWEVMILITLCGRLICGWMIRIAVFVIERYFLMWKRVLYFVYGLRRAVQNCLWIGLVLIAWLYIVDMKMGEETQSRFLPYVTKGIVCLLVGSLIWLLKIALVKVLASSFHVSTFFERIQESLFNQYVIESLSGPPSFEAPTRLEEDKIIVEVQKLQDAGTADLRETLLARSRMASESPCPEESPGARKPPAFARVISKKSDQGITVDHLEKLNPQNVSAWTMKRLIKIVRKGSLSTLDEQILDSDIEDDSFLQIQSERQAKEASERIFSNVANMGLEYIYLEDLMCFLREDEALKTMSFFVGVNEAKGISKEALKNWMVEAFKERRALALSLNDTKTSIDELHRMLDIIVAVIIVIIWLLILGIASSHVLVVISSQFLLVVFVFGNTCKTIFEALIFLFVMHPFDVGDRCEIDGIQMEVEEVKILTTVFLRQDKQKIRYPNSVLATKPIGNYYRSPHMSESIDFSIHISTPMNKLAIMRERIQEYVESKDEHWHSSSMVVVKDVEDMNKINMAAWVTHKMNHQDMRERWARRTLLIEEMIRLFGELDIDYRMLPLDVNVHDARDTISSRPLL